jgi:hypothetical protein
VQALPEDVRAQAYPTIRQSAVQSGAITEQDAPEQYDPAWWQQAISFGSTPTAPKTREVRTRGTDGTETIQIVEDTPGQSFTSTPEEKPDTRALNIQLADAIRRGDMPAASAIRRAIREAADASRDPNAGPRDPLETTTTWAVDPRDGVTKPMTLAEARRIGATQAPTADMRNKDAGKRTAARAVDAVRALGESIITKVGPAQRADAIKRGAEAVFGNDPEFQTYQDSRMALAGTLAVEQQGSRVSDADVKALWLPMVPDAYRDTAESYKLKWDLINAMRGVTGGTNGDVNITSIEEVP